MCPTGGVPWIDGPSATARRLPVEGVDVDAVLHPHPDHDGALWSQWGQGVVDEQGRFYSAIGDHRGIDGTSAVYEYDPATGRLRTVSDLAAVIGHQPGSWGYGKVHGALVAGPCGIHLSTYWGSRRNLEFDDHYRGDHLLLLDPANRTIIDLGVGVDRHGVPSLAGSSAHGLVYAEAVDPSVDGDDAGPFVVFDADGEERFRSAGDHVGFRAIAVDDRGRALFSTGGGELAVYDPDANDITGTVDGLPGQWLRAATSPAPDGTVYGVTRQPDALFALSPAHEVRPMGPVEGYTTSLALSPDGSTLYYVPHAHGDAWRSGAPLIAVDTTTGDQTVIARFNDAAEQEFGLTLGGSYNLAMAPDGSTLYIGMNAGPVGSGETFGAVILLVVHLDR